MVRRKFVISGWFNELLQLFYRFKFQLEELFILQGADVLINNKNSSMQVRPPQRKKPKQTL